MKKSRIMAYVTGGITIALISFVVFLLLLKLLWAWTIPDIFPGAVEQGLIVESLSWCSAIKIAVFIAFLSGLIRGDHSHKNLE